MSTVTYRSLTQRIIIADFSAVDLAHNPNYVRVPDVEGELVRAIGNYWAIYPNRLGRAMGHPRATVAEQCAPIREIQASKALFLNADAANLDFPGPSGCIGSYQS